MVLAAFTVWVSVDEVLPPKLVSPPYTPVIECAATDNEVVVKVAVPPLSVPVPNVVAPSLKVTVPVGVPEAGAGTATVAVKVTD